jgi:ribonuclease D
MAYVRAFVNYPHLHRSLICSQSTTVPRFGLAGYDTFEVTLARKSADVDNWVTNNLESAGHIGLDIEWLPDRSPQSRNKVALVQIATSARALLIQRHYFPELPHSIRQVIQNPKIMKVGVGIKSDLDRLLLESGVTYDGYFDIGTAAKDFYQLEKSGLQAIVKHIFK